MPIQTLGTFKTPSIKWPLFNGPSMTENAGKGDSDYENAGLQEFKLDSEIIADEDVFDPDESMPEAMPERSEELGELHRVLQPAARGDSPKNRLIFGKPGQGKTAGVKLKRNQLEKLAEANDLNITFVYVSCKDNPSSYDVAQTIIQKLENLENKPKGHQLSELYDRIYRYMNDRGGAYIIILDEVDAIRTHKSKYDEPNEPNILYKFPRSTMSESLGDNARLGLIGISNDRKFKKSLSTRCMDALGKTTINFNPYNVDQLRRILMRRASRGLKDTHLTRVEPGEDANADEPDEYQFESEVIDESQIVQCASWAANERGSMRQALRYIGNAASIADDADAARITDEHIEAAEAAVREQYVNDVLTDHTEDDLLAFCGVLWCEARGRMPATTKEIHNEYRSVCNGVDKRAKVQRRMTERLKDLDLTGAIDLEKQSGGRPGGEYFEVELMLPFGETLDVMQNEDPFAEEFEDIIAEIRGHARRNKTLT